MRFFKKTSILLGFAFLCLSFDARAQFNPDQNTIALPAPQKDGGASIMNAFADRRTTRDGYSGEALPDQTVSNLLWATFGINRPDGKRTIPTARNRQEIAVYLVLADAVWRYEGAGHALILESKGDYKSLLKGGSLALFYAAPQSDWDSMHIGSLYQNAGLFCAAFGLGNHVYASGIGDVQRHVKLPDGYTIRIGQTIGKVR